MRIKAKNSMPTVEYGGEIYKLKSRNIEVPDLCNMDSLAALVWLNRNTWPRGYQKSPDPLTGMGGAITFSKRRGGI